MDRISFIITQDGSVGLYDEGTHDIYHSVTGAATESFDKFIHATDFENFCKENNQVNILDICYGIGYNTKAAIYSALKNNTKIKMNITALELYKEVSFLSPFVKDNINCPSINIFLMSFFISKFEDFTTYITKFLDSEVEITKKYFDRDICLLFSKFIHSDTLIDDYKQLYTFLHNIYYQNISNSMETSINAYNINDIDFNINFGDARQRINDVNGNVNFVFLDAFTPHKQPLLWTYEFLSKVKSKMSNNSILSTYSNAAPIRKTFADLGFNIGKVILNDKQFGTVASFSKNKIKSPLSKYDIGLIKTKAGIVYHDNPDLNLSSDEILFNRKSEVANSKLLSSSKYRKLYENEQQI